MTPTLRKVRIVRFRIALTKAKLRLKAATQALDQAWRWWHAARRVPKKRDITWKRVLTRQSTVRKALREVDSLENKITRLKRLDR